MKLSTKGRYGLQVMVDIGAHATQNHVPLKSVSERLGVSESYLEQLIALLKKNKLVGSVRGAQGGYFLIKDPKETSIGEILRALEGSLAPTDCTCENNPHICSKGCSCVTKTVWEKLRDGINEVVDGIMLQELIEDYASTKINSCNL